MVFREILPLATFKHIELPIIEGFSFKSSVTLSFFRRLNSKRRFAGFSNNGDTTVPEENITQLVVRLRQGDPSAREGLAAAVYERLVKLSRKMLREGSGAVQRWEQTEDLAHAAWFRIQRALEDPSVEVRDQVHFFRLAARHIRFELIDLYRRHTGANGIAANHHTTPVSRSGGEEAPQNDGERFAANLTGDPQRLAAWGEFHVLVESLPEKEKEIIDLLWYQGLKQQVAADVLGVDVKTIKRRWRDLKILLSQKLEPDLIEF